MVSGSTFFAVEGVWDTKQTNMRIRSTTADQSPQSHHTGVIQLQRKSPGSSVWGHLSCLLLPNHNFRQCRVRGRVLSLTSSLSLSLPFCPNGEPGPHLNSCSSEASPNCRALGGLLFIAVKALTPYCAAVSGWIQHRLLLCRPQLFYAWVGWLGGSGSGHIFQICLDGWLFLCSVFYCDFLFRCDGSYDLPCCLSDTNHLVLLSFCYSAGI